MPQTDGWKDEVLFNCPLEILGRSNPQHSCIWDCMKSVVNDGLSKDTYQYQTNILHRCRVTVQNNGQHFEHSSLYLIQWLLTLLVVVNPTGFVSAFTEHF